MSQPDATPLEQLLCMQRQQMQICGHEHGMPGRTTAMPATGAAPAVVSGVAMNQQFASSIEASAAVAE